jgi:hypothetical protein
MTRRTCAAAIAVVALATAGAAFAQSPARAPETGNSCAATDYNCNTLPKGTGFDTTPTTKPTDPNAARLRNELRMPTPQISTEPEEPEQPIHSALEPEAPISNAH